MALFTRLDEIEPDYKNLQDWIFAHDNSVVKRLIQKCNNKFVGVENHSYVSKANFGKEFLKVALEINIKNNFMFYAAAQFQASQRVIEIENIEANRKRLEELERDVNQKKREVEYLQQTIYNQPIYSYDDDDGDCILL